MYPQMMNNYPIVGQPQNVTQTGIPFDHIRQRLYELAQQYMNNDVLSNTLYNELMGPGYNGLSGKMDELVNITAITIDYDYHYNGKHDLNTLLPEVVNEAYWCAWANLLNQYPQLNNDPSLNQNRHLIPQWQQHMRNRLAALQNAGLLRNNAVQNVQPWNTAAGVMPGGNQGYNGYNNPHQQPQYNQPTGGGYTGSYGRGGYTQGYGAGVNPNYQPREFSPYGNQMQQGVSHHALQHNNQNQQSGYQANQSGYQPVRMKPNGDVCYRNNELSSALANYQSNSTVLPQDQKGYQAQPAVQQTTQPKSEWSSNYQSSGLTAAVQQQANQTSSSGGFNFSDVSTVPEKKSVLPRQVQDWNNEPEPIKEVTWQAKPNPENQNFDLTDEKKLTEAFRTIQQRDAAYEGLRDDEVKVLTKAEVHAAIARGIKFEPPYHAIRAGNPFKVAIHCILTKNREIRQIVTQLGEPMRLSAHLDILKPVREDRVVKRDPCAGKTFVISTLGGVEFNRFAQSAVVLRDKMEKVAEAESEEEKAQARKEAFDAYQEQVEKDIKNDYSGLSRAMHENPEMSEDDFTLPEALGGNELTKIAIKTREERIVGEENTDIYETGAVPDNTSALLVNDIIEHKPAIDDVVRLNNYTKPYVLKVFNTPEELTACQEALFPFFKDNETRIEVDGDLVEAECRIYSNWLKDHEEEIPAEIWTFLNNRATRLINNYLKYSYSSDMTIDSFVEDFDDLVKVIQLEAKPNHRMILAHLDALIHLALRVFVKQSTLEAIDEHGNDYIKLRALTIDENYREYHVPAVASVMGLHDDVTEIDFDAYNSLFTMCNRLTLDQLFSHYRRDEENALPITSVYISFADGSRYRIYAVTESLEEEYAPATGDPLSDRFILVRMEDYI